MATLFISDLHLDPARPEITALFLDFLAREAGGDGRGVEALYILGDLFEAWIGDDDPSELAVTVAAGLRGLADTGVPVHFMRGNRDFLLGEDYARRAGFRILPDPAVIDLYGKPALLMHGDLLCTGDVEYQAFRAQSRTPEWQTRMLAQPLAVRQAMAAQARAASQARQGELRSAGTMETITDVAPDAVENTFIRYGLDLLIHGHTHRPAIHALPVGGRDRRRIVLGDWYEQGSVLRADAGATALESLSRG